MTQVAPLAVSVAVTVPLPAATNVTTPSELTVKSDVSLETKVQPEVTSVLDWSVITSAELVPPALPEREDGVDEIVSVT
jgi:hypothetical protein